MRGYPWDDTGRGNWVRHTRHDTYNLVDTACKDDDPTTGPRDPAERGTEDLRVACVQRVRAGDRV